MAKGNLTVFDVARLVGSTSIEVERNRKTSSRTEPYVVTPDFWNARDERVILFDGWVRMQWAARNKFKGL